MSDMQLFDVNRRIEITIPSSDGDKVIVFRFPTDAEWIERQRKRKPIVRVYGSGSETITPHSESYDAELFAKLRIGEGPEVDGSEASLILNQLSQAEISEPTSRDGATYRITLKVPGDIQTIHLLRIPTGKEALKFGDSYKSFRNLGYNNNQMTIDLELAGECYKRLYQKSEGYAGEIVPIVHQAMAVSEAMDYYNGKLGVRPGNP